MKDLLVLLLAVAILSVAVFFGWWPVTFAVGLVLALLYQAKRALWQSLLVGGLGWGIPLAVASASGAVVQQATLLGRILGIGGGAGTALALLLPSIVGGLLALFSSWIVSAIKHVVLSASGSQSQEANATMGS